MGVADRQSDHVEEDEPVTEDEQLTQEGDEPEGEEHTAEATDEGEDDEVVVQLGEVPPASEASDSDTGVLSDLRKRYRETKREADALREELAKVTAGQQPGAKPTLPDKPTLAAYDYDEEKWEQARDEWEAKRREVQAWEADQKTRADSAKAAAQKVLDRYDQSRASLKVKGYEDAEAEVWTHLTSVQKSLLIEGSANPAPIVYALFANPAELQRLAAIKNPVEFAWAASKLEDKVKVTTRTKQKPAPDTPLRSGSASVATTSTAQLDKLRAEAARTGDLSKVVAYKRQMRAAGK